ncbi:protein PAL OF QUIRKY isoform X2 [Ziziphus jujuba]|uniref:Protein PAL OF QUIRKY isoform X2 n=1 Tax=Ziziphus jujuba TaxID=326968 RepID=A0ABM3I1U0_ZIZJJ|nr:protein PAL OF QUIRKY isoform X2 [Ziziphus jujuba]XP_048318844.2 protein PAL OF QUIRKY isoform X2 [Ziziphus jujuba]
MVGPSTATIKFLCSYGGKILPRYPDGKLRYLGGETRVLAVDRSISFAELLLKMGELCGTSVSLRCQLPTEDLDALVSITCDEDLANLIEEYDRAASPPSNLKIRAFLSPPKSIKKISPPLSSASSSSSNYTASSSTPRSTMMPVVVTDRCFRQISPPAVVPFRKSTGKNIPHCLGRYGND